VKIVFDGRTLRPRRTGVGFFVERLLRALMAHDRNNEYLVLLNDESVCADWDVPDNFGAMIVRGNYESHPWGDLWERFALPKLLDRERADLFHGPAFRVPHTRCRCPTIVTVYDLACWRCGDDFPWGFRHYMRWQIRRSCASAAGIIATSQATAKDLSEVLGVDRAKVEVIYGAAEERFRPAASLDRQQLASIHPALARPYILTVGTIEPRKRISLLVAAYERAYERESRPNPLVIVGKVGWKSDASMCAIRQSSVVAPVHHLDYVNEDNLIAIYQGAVLFASATRYEGFGLPALEAMACGLPVIVTAGGASAEIVGDAGIVVEEADEQALEIALVSLLESEEDRNVLRQKALQRAAQFSWKTAAEQTIAFYEKTVRQASMR